MLWYLVKEPSMTHAPSMAGVAGFVWMWAAPTDAARACSGRCWGWSPDSSTLIRWQNALFAILPAYEASTLLVAAMRRRDRRERRGARH